MTTEFIANTVDEAGDNGDQHVGKQEHHRAATAWPCVWRRGHEFRTDRIGDGFAQDPVDFGLGRRIERPAGHLVNRLQLIGMTRAPQRRGDALVEHPTDRKVNYALAETLREPIEPLHGGHVLREPRLEELRVGAPQIVAIESRVRSHSTG
jgi:hypothetical protein